MPIKRTCPKCRMAFAFPDELRGQTVRCKSCQATFDVEPEASKSPPVVEVRAVPRETRMQEKPRLVSAPPTLRAVAEESPRPVPRRRSRPVHSNRGPMAAILLVVGGIAALLLIVGLGVGAYLLFGGPKNSSNSGDDSSFAGGFGGGGGAFGGGGGGALGGGGANDFQPLRYRWKGAPHVYNLRVELDLGDTLEIHQSTFVLNVAPNVPRGPANRGEEKGNGTGFVVHPSGYVVTCNHVVSDATKIEVILNGSTYPAQVVASNSATDLAVLKINAQNLPSLSLGDSDAAQLGQDVWVLGFPLSDVLGSNLKVTRGTVSGLNTKQMGRKQLQVDAAVNAGNSGGPLVNETGKVLGVTNAKLVGQTVTNVNFAVPSNEAKNLLSSKNLPYMTDGWNSKLDGPTLVKRVSAATALVLVTIGPGAEAESVVLSTNSALSKHEVNKPGAGRMPPMPRFPEFPRGGRTRVEVDSSGRVLRASGGIQMPMLLGDIVQFLIDPLPQDNRPNWESSNQCTIGIVEDSGGRGGPPGFPGFPGGRFGTPRMPGFGGPPGFPGGPGGPGFGPGFGPGVNDDPAPKNVRTGDERTSYSRQGRAGDTVTIHKTYQLKVPPTATSNTSLDLSGQGNVNFDTRNGLPQNIDFKANFQINSGNTSLRVPITVTCKLLQGAEREQVLKPPTPPKQEPPKPMTDADITQIIADLKGTNRQRINAALGKLQNSQPTARRAEVAKALEPILEDKDFWTRKACIAAIGVWGTKENVPGLLKLVADENVFIRRDSITALGKLQDERAAEPIAKRLTDFGDRGHAAQVLRQIGSKAEKAVIPYLSHSDWGVRMEACHILKDIGTKDSKPELEKAVKDSNGSVAGSAKEALTAISARP